MRWMVGSLSLMLMVLSAGAGAATQTIAGPAQHVSLFELYTSEGCDSCPPAEEWISKLQLDQRLWTQLVPVTFHVDYWDYLGWKEPFAQSRFSERQSWLVRTNGHKTVFTPHFFVSGKEVRDWHGGLDDELKRVTAQPARADIRIHAESIGPGALSVAATATAPPPGDQLGLFVVLTEDKLTSSVAAGENRGVTLTHDHVVREWIGPIALNAGHAAVKQTVTTRSNWNSAQLGIAAFVQDLRTGQVLQAVGASQCARS